MIGHDRHVHILMHILHSNLCQMGSTKGGQSKGKLCCYDARPPWRLPGEGIRVHHQPRTPLDWSITWWCGFLHLPWRWCFRDKMPLQKTRNCSLTESCKDSSFCLGIGEDGVMAQRHIHKYMFQVQVQMHIAEVSYCDFLVWTPQEVFTQRIVYDPLFFHDAYGKVVNFIKTGVLPELLGKWYTAPRLTPIATKQRSTCRHRCHNLHIWKL